MRFDHLHGLPVDEQPVTVDLQIPPLRSDDLVVWLSPLRVYSDGLGFTLMAFGRITRTDNGWVDHTCPAARLNLGYVYHPGMQPWLRLEARLPGGVTATNDPRNHRPPADPTQPWLRAAGGVGPHSADFLLAPLPSESGPLILTMSYPELNMPPTSVELDYVEVANAAGRTRRLW